LTKSMINEENFFSNIVANMGSREKFAEELVENARRAKARNVSFTYKELNEETSLVTIENDGDILLDMKNLLIFAESNYDKEVIRTENPAGAGVYLIMSVADMVVFHSGKNKLKVEPKRLLEDKHYRANIFSAIKECSYSFSGMKIKLYISDHKKLVEKVFSEVKERTHKLDGYLDINITYNGTELTKKVFEAFVSKEGEGELGGLTILIEKNTINQFGTSGMVFWHGKKIKVKGLFPFTVIVRDNHLFTPVLPDRTKMANTSEEIESIRLEVEKQLQKEIQVNVDRDSDIEIDKQDLLNALTLPYSTELLNEWEGVKKEEAEEKGVMFFSTANEDKIFMHYKVGNSTEYGEAVEEELTSMTRNLSWSAVYFAPEEQKNKNITLPSWVRDIFHKEPMNGWTERTKQQEMSSQCVNRFDYFDKIEIGTSNQRKEIDCLILRDGDVVYISSFDVEGELDGLAEDATCGSYETSLNEYLDHLHEDLDKLSRMISQEVSLAKVIEDLEGCLLAEGIEGNISSFSYCTKNKKIKVVSNSGEEREYKISLS